MKTLRPHSPQHENHLFAPSETAEQDCQSRQDYQAMPEKTRSAKPAPTPPPLKFFQRAWRLALVPDALDRLRDHPDFDIHGERAALDATGHVLSPYGVRESDREAIRHLELLRIFRQRMQFLSNFAILLIPLFAFVFMRLMPATQQEVVITHFLMMIVSISLRVLARRVSALWQARFLSLLSYALYAVGAAVLVALMDQNQFNNQFLVYYTHNYIMLSVLFLPYTVWETLVVGAILMASLAWSAWWAVQPGIEYFYVSHLFVLAITILFVVCIAHFQSVLRRMAFDAAFDLAQAAAQLSELSTTDVVTGGYNRLQAEKTLAIEIARAARFERPLSLIMFDLDNFKEVNDNHGHAAGDEILREVWQSAMSTIREIDTCARFGGDEFLIVLPETSAYDANAIAERLQSEVQTRLQSRFGAHTPEGRVTLSIGITTFRGSDPIASGQFLAQADARLYEAKRAGKNQIAW
jgi:diguanylate cyclase (GGDEF)-like protein